MEVVDAVTGRMIYVPSRDAVGWRKCQGIRYFRIYNFSTLMKMEPEKRGDSVPIICHQTKNQLLANFCQVCAFFLTLFIVHSCIMPLLQFLFFDNSVLCFFLLWDTTSVHSLWFIQGIISVTSSPADHLILSFSLLLNLLTTPYIGSDWI